MDGYWTRFGKRINNINFVEPKSYEDEFYIQKCFLESDFGTFIGVSGSFSQNFLLIKKNQCNIGIFCPNIKFQMGICNAVPILYMKHKKSINTIKVIISIFNYLFGQKHVDRVEIRILGINEQMLQIMRKSMCTYEGMIKYVLYYNGILVDIHYYSMLYEEFEILNE